MIAKLRRRFILICTVSVLSVVALVLGVILVWNLWSLNKTMDVLADRVSEGGGRFPGAWEEGFFPEKIPPKNEAGFGFITPETPFSTRHFTVIFDKAGEAVKIYTESIYAITEEQAVEYARAVLEGNHSRGWQDNYRYKVFSDRRGTGVVFVDGSMNRSATVQSVAIAGVVLFVCAALVLILILLLSKRAVKPMAESYEKQKQFITDANHELKTPLTLILANLDIAESELGKNEWLDDIRFEGQRMSELVNRLVSLSRMDEEAESLNGERLPFGQLVSDTVSEFEPLALSRGKRIVSQVDPAVVCYGERALLLQLVGILMDNAVKYCDAGGEIFVGLSRGRQVVFTVENSYEAVGELELPRLFDRFYRADKARTFQGGYGVGLSMAKAIAQKHKGELTAYQKDSSHIGFQLVLRDGSGK